MARTMAQVGQSVSLAAFYDSKFAVALAIDYRELIRGLIPSDILVQIEY